MRRLVLLGAVGVAILLSSCSRTIVPEGETAERVKAAGAEGPFAAPIEERSLPDLSATASLPAVLEYAFKASGDIETAYREWRAAIERIPQAGAFPDPRLNLSLMFAPVNIKNFQGIFGDLFNQVSFMLEQEIPGKGKRSARAALALAEAQASGERFRAAKFALQNRVVSAWAALTLNAALQEQRGENIRLLKETHEAALQRYHAGAGFAGGQGAASQSMGEQTVLADLRKIEVEIQAMESDLRELQIERPRLAAELNRLLNRPPEAILPPVAVFPEIQAPEASDSDLFARAVRANPQLASLRREIEERGAIEVLADLEKRPDFMLGAGTMARPMMETPSGGGMGAQPRVKTGWMPMLNLGMTLPINRDRIRAMIAESEAMRQAAEARLRAARSDALARVVVALAMLRDAQRVLTDYGERIAPRARELFDAQMAEYGAGGGDLLDLLDTERMLVDFRELILRAQAARLRAYGELEEAVGEDLFRMTNEE